MSRLLVSDTNRLLVRDGRIVTSDQAACCCNVEPASGWPLSDCLTEDVVWVTEPDLTEVAGVSFDGTCYTVGEFTTIPGGATLLDLGEYDEIEDCSDCTEVWELRECGYQAATGNALIGHRFYLIGPEPANLVVTIDGVCYEVMGPANVANPYPIVYPDDIWDGFEDCTACEEVECVENACGCLYPTLGGGGGGVDYDYVIIEGSATVYFWQGGGSCASPIPINTVDITCPPYSEIDNTVAQSCSAAESGGTFPPPSGGTECGTIDCDDGIPWVHGAQIQTFGPPDVTAPGAYSYDDGATLYEGSTTCYETTQTQTISDGGMFDGLTRAVASWTVRSYCNTTGVEPSPMVSMAELIGQNGAGDGYAYEVDLDAESITTGEYMRIDGLIYLVEANRPRLGTLPGGTAILTGTIDGPYATLALAEAA